MGQFKPGESGNLAGRPPGAMNKTVIKAREVVVGLLEEGLTIEKVQEYLLSLDPKDRIQVLLKLLEYVLPKLSSIKQHISSSDGTMGPGPTIIVQDKETAGELQKLIEKGGHNGDTLNLTNLTLEERKQYLQLVRKCTSQD